MGPDVGVAEYIVDELFVDAEAGLEEDDGGVGGDPGEDAADCGEGLVGFCCDDEGFDGAGV